MTGTQFLEKAQGFLDSRNLVLARECFHRAEQLGGDRSECGAGRWMVAMLLGDFEEAWKWSDVVLAEGMGGPNLLWNGSSIAGSRLMVRCLHGLGDAVQMFRYAFALEELARQVIYEVPPRMFPLVGCFAGLKHAITWGAEAPSVQPDWDLQVEITEVPYLLRTHLSDLPIQTNYLAASPELVRTVRKGMDLGKTRIGLAWAAGEWKPDRSIPFHLLEKLSHSRPDVEYWSLQGGQAARDADRSVIRDAEAEFGDGLPVLAAVIENLDLVITVDTLIAHMAGAMGKPTWVLLQQRSDWRWMVGRNDSPWYPSLQLFRQREEGVWEEPLFALDWNLDCFLRQKAYESVRLTSQSFL